MKVSTDFFLGFRNPFRVIPESFIPPPTPESLLMSSWSQNVQHLSKKGVEEMEYAQDNLGVVG